MIKTLVQSTFLLLILSSWALAQDITSNLVGHWKLDEASGTLADSGSSGTTLTTAGSPTYNVAGKIGTALTFLNTSAQYASATITSGSALWPGTGDWTIAAWVKLTSAALATNGIMGMWHSNGIYWYVQIRVSDNHLAFQAQMSDADRTQGGGNTAILDTNWHHIAIAFARAANATHYLDGSPDGTVSMAGLNGDNLTSGSNQEWNLANIGQHLGGFYLNGTLDEVRVYRRALNDAEIAALAAYTGPIVARKRVLTLE
jgi:hypothetical protein